MLKNHHHGCRKVRPMDSLYVHGETQAKHLYRKWKKKKLWFHGCWKFRQLVSFKYTRKHRLSTCIESGTKNDLWFHGCRKVRQLDSFKYTRKHRLSTCIESGKKKLFMVSRMSESQANGQLLVHKETQAKHLKNIWCCEAFRALPVFKGVNSPQRFRR